MKSICSAIHPLLICTSAISGNAMAEDYESLPPPLLTVAIEAVDLEGVRVETGKEYSIYIDSSRLPYSALLTDASGEPLYEEVPARVEKCEDSALAWPDRTVAHVQALVDNKEGAELVAYAGRLNPCLLILDLPIVIPSAGSPPNRGDPL